MCKQTSFNTKKKITCLLKPILEFNNLSHVVKARRLGAPHKLIYRLNNSKQEAGLLFPGGKVSTSRNWALVKELNRKAPRLKLVTHKPNKTGNRTSEEVYVTTEA